MSRRKVDAKSRRAAKRSGLIKTFSFEYCNGAGTSPSTVECEQCGRQYPNGWQTPTHSLIGDRSCLCGHEYVRYV